MTKTLSAHQVEALSRLALNRPAMCDHRTRESLVRNGWAVYKTPAAVQLTITDAGKDALRAHLTR